MVGRVGVEPTTSRLSGVRSNHLSYRPPTATKQTRKDRVRLEPAQAYTSFVNEVFSRMKGHEDGGKCSLERRKLFPTGRPKSKGKALSANILRKEVIQPQVPLRLPCYDFTPVSKPTVVACLLAVSAAPSGESKSHGVTGGVYKAWERIHRGMLIRDY